uniref:Uncharacterized protein n=1 Tax=Oryza barthii TaxID=65489 RepID=A0A0D3GG87_9ORYZ
MALGQHLDWFNRSVHASWCCRRSIGLQYGDLDGGAVRHGLAFCLMMLVRDDEIVVVLAPGNRRVRYG